MLEDFEAIEGETEVIPEGEYIRSAGQQPGHKSAVDDMKER